MKPKRVTPQTSASEFPALRNFLRGYFHEDLGDEYGSPEAAARQFCQDADESQRKALAEEWARFLARMKGQPLEAINHALANLGSACILSQSDIERVSKVLQG
jgi:CdiI immunity protein